jgi:hypothetical protein
MGKVVGSWINRINMENYDLYNLSVMLMQFMYYVVMQVISFGLPNAIRWI